MPGGAMAREMMARRGRLMYRMSCGTGASRGDALRASHMHRRFARYPCAESQAVAALGASLVSDRAQRMALLMVAGAAAWPVGSPGGRNNENAHMVILVPVLMPSASFRLLVAPLPHTVRT